MKVAYALLGLLFLLVFGGAFFFIGNDKEPEYAGGRVEITDEEIPIIPDVPRDGIPPLDEPKYESVAEAGWLLDDDIVLGIDFDGDIRAYPIKIMNWHEIVNETINGEPVIITYCPLCDSGIVFDGHIGNQHLTFGNTGSLYESSMVMYDRQTESQWYQAGGVAITGELKGRKLRVLPSFMSRWSDWKVKYPDSQVLSRETGHRRPYETNSFSGYDRLESAPGFPVSKSSDALPPKERIIGFELNGETKAYPIRLYKGEIIQDTFARRDIEIVVDSEGRTAEAFFVRNGQRVRAPIVSEFWFSWYASHPETEVYTNTGEEV